LKDSTGATIAFPTNHKGYKTVLKRDASKKGWYDYETDVGNGLGNTYWNELNINAGSKSASVELGSATFKSGLQPFEKRLIDVWTSIDCYRKIRRTLTLSGKNGTVVLRKLPKVARPTKGKRPVGRKRKLSAKRNLRRGIKV